MKIDRWAVIVGFLLCIVAIGGAKVVSDLNNTLIDSNNRLQVGRYERVEFQYRSLLLSCNSAGAQNSLEPEVRQICDEVVPELRELIESLQENVEDIQLTTYAQ